LEERPARWRETESEEASDASIGVLVLRGVVGVLFMGHGTQKLFGWVGVCGLNGTGAFYESRC
jgi:uncharacterized membrane protein YphA (DoxX/SURF4 family)